MLIVALARALDYAGHYSHVALESILSQARGVAKELCHRRGEFAKEDLDDLLAEI